MNQTYHNVVWDRKKIADLWDVFENNPDISHQFYPEGFYEELIYESKKILNQNKEQEILDAGFGTGTLLKILKNNGFINLYGIDLSEKNVSDLSHTQPTLHLKVGTMTQIPYETEKFDIVFSTEVIEHLLNEDLIKGISEIYRVLKKGGYIIISTPHAEKKAKIVCPDCHAIFEPYQHLQSFDRKKIQELFSNHFKIVSFNPIRLLLLSFPPLLRRMVRKPLNPLMNKIFEPGGNLFLILQKY